MDRSRLIAGLVGPTLTAVAASLLINPPLRVGLMMSLADSPSTILLIGIATLVSGLAIVITHNVWRGWPTVLTLFGWNAVFAGLFRIIFPTHIASRAAELVAASWALPTIVVLLLVLGLFLSWKAFRS